MTSNCYVDFKISGVIKIKGKYGFRIYLKLTDGSKTTKQHSGFETKKTASEARDKAVAELYTHTYVLNKKLTVSEYLDDWLENEIKKAKRSATYSTYHYCIKNHIAPYIGKIKICELSRLHINYLYEKVSEKSYSNAKMVRNILKTSLKHANDRQQISSNPTEGICLPKQSHNDNKPQKTLTAEQVGILIENAKGTKIYLFVLFAALMGLRRGEILGLKYSDIDFENHTIHITRQLGKDVNKSAPVKNVTKQEIPLKTNSSDRIIAMPDVVYEAVIKERTLYEKHRNRRKKTFVDADYICCSTYGRPRSPAFVYQPFKELLKKCSLPDIRFHDLRHTCATILFENGVDMQVISDTLGHSKPSMSFDVYGDKTRMQIVRMSWINGLNEYVGKVLYKTL